MKEITKHYETPSVTVMKISDSLPICTSPGYDDQGLPGFDNDHTKDNTSEWVI